MLNKYSFRTAIIAVLFTVGCSASEAPDELPFADNPEAESSNASTGDVTVDDSGEASSDSNGVVSDPDVDTAIPLPDVWESIDIDPALAACYSDVYGDAGVTEVTDLRDLADRSADLSLDDQAQLANCLNADAE